MAENYDNVSTSKSQINLIPSQFSFFHDLNKVPPSNGYLGMDEATFEDLAFRIRFSRESDEVGRQGSIEQIVNSRNTKRRLSGEKTV